MAFHFRYSDRKPYDALDSGDHASVLVRFLELWALLDMELKIKRKSILPVITGSRTSSRVQSGIQAVPIALERP
jgi:hypothetical protein